MNTKFLLGFFGFLMICNFPQRASAAVPLYEFQKSLKGKITDVKTGEPLAGVTIYIPDLRKGTVSNPDGSYQLDHLPSARLLVELRLTGYKTLAQHVDLETNERQDFQMQETVSELHEIVVTGLSKAAERNRTPTPITTVPKELLWQNSYGNIVDALSGQAGIAQITTGNGISKPVIRGLGYNRVVLVHNGIRQEGQQWGDEHGIEVDAYSVDKVEILKGAASLAYGSDAMAGVINLIDAPTVPDGSVQIKPIYEVQTNPGLTSGYISISSNKDGWITSGNFGIKKSKYYQNPYDGFVFNSAYNEQTINATLGTNKAWGYSHIHLGYYNAGIGIVEGERDSSGAFIRHVGIHDSIDFAIPIDKSYASSELTVPYQKINHYKVVFDNNFYVGNGNVKAVFGWQQNNRKEFGDIFHTGQYGLYFRLNSFHYDVRYLWPEWKQWNLSMGIQGMLQFSANKGIEYLIPEYNLSDVGIYAIARKSYERLDISGGIRLDRRDQSADDLFLNGEGQITPPGDTTAEHRFVAFDARFTGLSASLGATYQFTEYLNAKINVARGFRAPNIAELGSNGEHEGTLRYESGNPSLKAEHNLQFDFGLGLSLHHVTSEVSLFHNTIDNYIFLHKLQSIDGGDSLQADLPVFQYTAGKAKLYGGEFVIDVHPHPFDWLHFENSLSWVRAVQSHQPDSTRYLPFIPAAKWHSELKADFKKMGKHFSNIYLKFFIEHHFAQNHFYKAYNTETATPAYTLLHAGIGADYIYKNKTLFSFNVHINNLADVAYQSHLSRLKYADANPATGRRGVFNPGRNIGIKFVIPLKFNLKTDSSTSSL